MATQVNLLPCQFFPISWSSQVAYLFIYHNGKRIDESVWMTAVISDQGSRTLVSFNSYLVPPCSVSSPCELIWYWITKEVFIIEDIFIFKYSVGHCFFFYQINIYFQWTCQSFCKCTFHFQILHLECGDTLELRSGSLTSNEPTNGFYDLIFCVNLHSL